MKPISYDDMIDIEKNSLEDIPLSRGTSRSSVSIPNQDNVDLTITITKTTIITKYFFIMLGFAIIIGFILWILYIYTLE